MPASRPRALDTLGPALPWSSTPYTLKTLQKTQLHRGPQSKNPEQSQRPACVIYVAEAQSQVKHLLQEDAFTAG